MMDAALDKVRFLNQCHKHSFLFLVHHGTEIVMVPREEWKFYLETYNNQIDNTISMENEDFMMFAEQSLSKIMGSFDNIQLLFE